MPRSKPMPDSFVEDWVQDQAHDLYFERCARTGIGGAPGEEELKADRHLAEVYFASNILERERFFFGPEELNEQEPHHWGHITSASYWRLEKVWLMEIKQLIAYFEARKILKDP